MPFFAPLILVYPKPWRHSYESNGVRHGFHPGFQTGVLTSEKLDCSPHRPVGRSELQADVFGREYLYEMPERVAESRVVFRCLHKIQDAGLFPPVRLCRGFEPEHA